MSGWKKLNQQYKFQGYRNIIQKTYELPNGNMGDFDIIDDKSFVSVVAITADDRVLLVEQFRPGPEMNMLSFPAGYIEEGESMETAAARELLEETGYQVDQLTFLKEVTNPYSHIVKYSFLATGCKKIADQQLDDNEFATVIDLSIPELKELLLDPTSTNFANLDCGFLALNALNQL